MNFFEHQSRARRQSWRLLLYFGVAVLLTVLAVNAGFYFLGRLLTDAWAGTLLWHDWSAQAYVGTLLVIASGSLREYLRLRGGGQAVAETMGARRVDFASKDSRERQYLNVVAEMAIASGVPAPVLYVMDAEPGINAFVAGLRLDETVMVVTAGALENFDRDALQAVVGHEFSHILNGDMRLNVRLLALLAGLLALGQLGSFLMRNSADLSWRDNSRRRSGFSPHLLAVGLLLWLVGALGLFFARLIKAAISRQREFLADASSVQFTRNPDALAEALIAIKHQNEQSWLRHIRAESLSHMCFGETLKFSRLLATHPPLEERIAALGRGYLARERVRRRARAEQEAAHQQLAQEQVPGNSVRELAPLDYDGGASPDSASASTAAPAAPLLQALSPALLLARAGQVDPAQLASARELYQRLPAAIHRALQTASGVQALLYAVLARQCAVAPSEQAAFMQRHEPDLLPAFTTLQQALQGLDLAFALPLTELALPRLQLLPVTAQRQLLARLQAFAALDKQLSSFEFALLMLVRKQLTGVTRAPRAMALPAAAPAVAVLVATLLRQGGLRDERLQQTYQRLMRTQFAAVPALPESGSGRLSQLALLLQSLGGLSLADKKRVLELAATAVLADGRVTLEEYELLRASAALLDCPLPLLAA